MFEEMREWLASILGTGYVIARGRWDEDGTNALTKFGVVVSLGGPNPDVEDRRQNYRLLLVGPRNDMAATDDLQADIYALARAILARDTIPCGAADVQSTGEPTGPGYTTENRAWYSLDIQIIF